MNKIGSIEVKVRVIDTEPMKQIISLVKAITDDVRIDQAIRNEYTQELYNIIDTIDVQ